MRSIPVILSALALSACGFSANAEGPESSRDFPVGDFSGIISAGAQDVDVVVGGAPGVRAEGSEKALDALDIRVEDGVLKLNTKKHEGWALNKAGRVKLFVSAPRLDQMMLAGAGNANIDKIDGPRFKGQIAGAGDLKIASLNVQEAELAIIGAGALEANGIAKRGKVEIKGAGSMELEGLKTDDVAIAIYGSGNVDANASQTAAVSISGTGSVSVSGGAKCAVSKRGVGSVSCK